MKSIFSALCVTVLATAFVGCAGPSGLSSPAEPMGREPAAGATILKMGSSAPGFTSYFVAGTVFSQKVGEKTNEKLFFDLPKDNIARNPIALLTEVSVNQGMDALWSSAYLFQGANTAFPLFSWQPFSSVSIDEFYNWLTTDARPFYEEAYGEYNVKAIPCGASGPDGFWSRRQIQDIQSFKNMTVRTVGYHKQAYDAEGIKVRPLNGGQSSRAIKNMSIDAVDLLTPTDDFMILHYPDNQWRLYYPGGQIPFTMIDLIINKDVWNGLSQENKTIIEGSCRENVMNTYNLSTAKDKMILDMYVKKSIAVAPFPEAAQTSLRNAWYKIADNIAESDPLFKDVQTSFIKRFGQK